MIYPYFYYCNIVWASTYPSRSEKHNCTTKRIIIKIISGCKYRDHTFNYFKELPIGLLKFPDINIFQTSLFMFKVGRHHRLLPLHLKKSFYRNSEIHQYCTRSSENYYLKSVNISIKQFSIKYKGPNVWNSIPITIQSLNRITRKCSVSK